MRVTRVLILSAVIALAACRGENPSVTGSYGSGVLAGSVVLNGIEGSPEGMEVSVRDTGMTTTLGADGRFVFSGVPHNAVLDFRRGDGIQASLVVNGGGGSVLIEIGKHGATRGNKTKEKREYEGVIKSANGSEIVLLTSHNDEIVIGLDGETAIRRGNTTLTPAGLADGMRVHVRARRTGDKLVAQQIVVQDGDDDDGDDDQPAVREFEGTIVSAGASELTIVDSHKREVKFVLNGDSRIRKGNAAATPADLLPGQRVHVKAAVAADGTATALQVILQNTNEAVSVSGTVAGVSGGNISVDTKAGRWTVQTDASTRIRKKGKTIGLSDIAAGDSLSAKGRQVSANTVLASEVEVRGRSGHP